MIFNKPERGQITPPIEEILYNRTFWGSEGHGYDEFSVNHQLG